mgnify:CR=1 FL=1
MSTVVQSYVTIYLVGLLLSDICSLARKRAAIVAIDVSWLCYSCRRSTVPLQTQLNKKSNAPPIVEPESVSDQESGCTTAQWIWFPLVTTLYAVGETFGSTKISREMCVEQANRWATSFEKAVASMPNASKPTSVFLNSASVRGPSSCTQSCRPAGISSSLATNSSRMARHSSYVSMPLFRRSSDDAFAPITASRSSRINDTK